MLTIIRITLALLCLVAATLLFVDVSGFAARHLAWLPRLQFMTALLSLNAVVIAALILLTLVLGRVYCSVICPLGVFQDVINRLRSRFGGKKSRNRFGFKPERKILRYGFLALFAVLVALGLTHVTAMAMAGLLDPYSAFGRIASELFAPVYDGACNLLADWSESQGNYYFTRVAYVTRVPLLIVAALTFVVVVVFAWIGGRSYCNMICPVGTILGLLSRNALLRPVIDTSLCNGCRKCERNCKASCIDGKNHRIDYSRCVVCMDCIGNCSQHAISFSPVLKKTKNDGRAVDGARRRFIVTGAALAGSLAAAAHKEGDGALAPVKMKKRAVRLTDIVPAGAKSAANLRSHCTACQLCISSCPDEVLQPSTDLTTFMQPVMWYNKGYCRPECTRCSDVCPTGAIEPVSVEEKSSVKIGTAVVDADRCISVADGKHCGLCSRSCPAGAIEMVKIDGNMRPVVNEGACIGCGSCEYHCPVGTAGHLPSERAAIYVEGLSEHRLI